MYVGKSVTVCVRRESTRKLKNINKLYKIKLKNEKRTNKLHRKDGKTLYAESEICYSGKQNRRKTDRRAPVVEGVFGKVEG